MDTPLCQSVSRRNTSQPISSCILTRLKVWRKAFSPHLFDRHEGEVYHQSGLDCCWKSSEAKPSLYFNTFIEFLTLSLRRGLKRCTAPPPPPHLIFAHPPPPPPHLNTLLPLFAFQPTTVLPNSHPHTHITRADRWLHNGHPCLSYIRLASPASHLAALNQRKLQWHLDHNRAADDGGRNDMVKILPNDKDPRVRRIQ